MISVEIDGVKYSSLKQACIYLNKDYSRVYSKYRLGASIEEAFDLCESKRELELKGLRKCKSCEQILSLRLDFYALDANCKACIRDKRMQKTYGITEQDRLSIFESQLGLCAICQTQMSLYSRTTHLDHSHSSSRVRGLLCSLCNSGLGSFKDDPKILENAIQYLRKNS